MLAELRGSGRCYGAPYLYRKAKETLHGLIFSWLSWLAVLVVGANVKEKSREQELAGTELVRVSQEEREREWARARDKQIVKLGELRVREKEWNRTEPYRQSGTIRESLRKEARYLTLEILVVDYRIALQNSDVIAQVINKLQITA